MNVENAFVDITKHTAHTNICRIPYSGSPRGSIPQCSRKHHGKHRETRDCKVCRKKKLKISRLLAPATSAPQTARPGKPLVPRCCRMFCPSFAATRAGFRTCSACRAPRRCCLPSRRPASAPAGPPAAAPGLWQQEEDAEGQVVYERRARDAEQVLSRGR